MLNILLCDDDPFILGIASDKINKIVAEGHFDAALACAAQNSGEMLRYIKNNPGEYLIFLDLDFGEGHLNGIDIAKALRQSCTSCKIVFTTNHHGMAVNVLKSGVEPFGFLEKTSNIGELENGYQRYIQMALQNQSASAHEDVPYVSLRIGIDEDIDIPLVDVVFVETEPSVSHGVTYHTVNGSRITIISTLEAEQVRLGDGFIRTHRSCLVNKRKILNLKDGYVKLANQQEVPCSFRQRSEVKKWIP